MRYRIAFEKDSNRTGAEASVDPSFALNTFLTDGIVAEKMFKGRLEPQAQQCQGVLDKDDAFLGRPRRRFESMRRAYQVGCFGVNG